MNEYLAISNYIIPFIIAVFVSAFFTVLVRRFALRKNITDSPESSQERKIQTKPVPLLGGMAVFLSGVIVVAGYTFFSDRVLGGYMLPKYLIGIFIAGLLLIIGGYLDDKYNLKPSKQIFWPIVACIVIIVSGIGIEYITNPFGGVFYLDIPFGNYDKNEPVNMGTNQWNIRPSIVYGGLYGHYNIDTSLYCNIRFEDEDTNFKPGDEFWYEYGCGKKNLEKFKSFPSL